VVYGIPTIAVGYLVGLAAVCYHFANGLVGFCFSWGFTVSRRALRRVAGVAGVLAVVLFAMGANLVLYFATGSRLAWSLHDPSGRPAVGCGDLEDQQTGLAVLGEGH
jgi:succinate dehydrogenase / fumarate reductase cytochrome b subunit